MCECWTEDIWRAIHILAISSQIIENEEKAAFCTFIVSINRLISCPKVESQVCFFMSKNENDITTYMSSNQRLLLWTQRLRQHLNETLFKKRSPTMDELVSFYNVKTLTKDVWGPSIWKMIHHTLLCAKLTNGTLDSKTQDAIKAFLVCTAILIPCPKCRSHAWEYYSSQPIDPSLQTNITAFNWSVIFHNDVTNRINTETGTKRPTFTPEQAIHLYEKSKRM
jgi:hypothetical protein